MAQPMPRTAQRSIPRTAQRSIPRTAQRSIPHTAQRSIPHTARWAMVLGVVVMAGLTLGFLAGLARPRARAL